MAKEKNEKEKGQKMDQLSILREGGKLIEVGYNNKYYSRKDQQNESHDDLIRG